MSPSPDGTEMVPTSKGPKSRAACRERQPWSAPSQEADADTPCGSRPGVATSTRLSGCSARRPSGGSDPSCRDAASSNSVELNVVHMPRDGWCFFYAVSRYFKGSTHSGRSTAAEIHLQAIEWLLAAQHGPHADAVATACVPFDEDELRLHEHFLRQQPTAAQTAPSNTTEVVLLSKLHALLLQPAMLDSIHHASAGVELWALTLDIHFDQFIWYKWSFEPDRYQLQKGNATSRPPPAHHYI